MSTVRVYQASVTSGGTSKIRVYQASVTDTSPSVSKVRLYQAQITGSVPAAGTSKVRVYTARITGNVGITRPTSGTLWTPATQTWPPAKMRVWDPALHKWLVVFGSPDSNPDPGPPDPPDQSDPTADAGAVPIGTAAYNVAAGSVFVSTTGNDTTGSGTQTSPYRTLSKALTVIPSVGGSIVMRAGEYNEGELSSSKQFTLQNFPSETVWFDGSVITTNWTAQGSTWRTPYTFVLDRSPTFTRGAADSTTPGWQFINPSYPMAAAPDMVIYDGQQLTQVATLAQCGPGCFYVEGTQSGMIFTPTNLYIGSTPTGHEVRITNKKKFITLSGDGTILRGIGVRRYSNSQPDLGIIISAASNTLMENMIITDTATNSVSHQGGTTKGFNCVVRKVTVRNAGNIGLHANQADGLLHDRVDVQFCNREHFNPAPAAGGIKITRQQGYTLRNSISSNNYDSKGWWADETVGNGILVNNRFESDGQIGLAIEICTGTWVVANNKVIGAFRDGMILINTHLIRLWNNTVVNTGGNSLNSQARCVDYIQDTRRPDDGTSPGKDPRQSAAFYQQTANRWVIDDIEDCNNVITDPKAGSQGLWCLIVNNVADPRNQPAKTFLDYTPTVDGNVYHWGSTTKPTFPYLVPSGSTNPLSYQSLTSFKAAFPSCNANSTEYVGTSPVDANGVLKTTLAAGLHAKAKPLPADIAALIGQPIGAQRAGTFW